MALKLKIKPIQNFRVIDFNDEPTYIKITEGPTNNDCRYSKKFTFKLWLDTSQGYSNSQVVLCYGDNSFDYFNFNIDGSWFNTFCGVTSSGGRYVIGNYDNQVLNCEVNKRFNGSQGLIESFYINGELQSKVLNAESLGIGTARWSIGGGNALNYADNLSVWDVRIYDTSSNGELIHYWKGYPDPSADSSWVDNVGSLDGVVINPGDVSSRILSGSVDSAELTQKMVFKPYNTINGALDFDGNDIYVEMNSVPDLTGNKLISFNFYSDTSSFLQGFYQMNSGVSGDFGSLAFINDLTLSVYANSFSGERNWNFDLSPAGDFYKKISKFEIKKSSSGVVEVKLNGVICPSTSSLGAHSIISRKELGRAEGSYYMNGSIWNFKVYENPDTTNTLIYNWVGYPDGNTNSAWIDTTLSGVDGSISGTSPFNTRDVSGGSSGSIASSLKITG